MDIDYERMGRQLVNAFAGIEVKMDGEKVGDLVTTRVDNNLGHKTTISERGG